jgi:hypothetical protein
METLVFTGATISNTFLVTLINNLSVSIFILFSIIGIGYMLYKKNFSYATVVGVFALMTIIIYIPSPLMALWQTMVLFRFDRFNLFLSPFMSIVMGLGIIIATKYYYTKVKDHRIVSIMLIFLFVLYAGSGVGLIKNEQAPARSWFNNDEILGFEFILSHTPYGSVIYSDYYISKFFFSQRYFSKSDSFHLPYYKSVIISDASMISALDGVIVIPNKQFTENGMQLSKGGELNPEGGLYPYFPTDENIQDLSWSLKNKNKIYDSDAIAVYSNK